MEESNIEYQFNKLIGESQNPNDPQHRKLVELARQARQNHKRLEKSLQNLQESLGYLRVCIKYQIFDFEATRRERDDYRKLLEENNS